MLKNSYYAQLFAKMPTLCNKLVDICQQKKIKTHKGKI